MAQSPRRNSRGPDLGVFQRPRVARSKRSSIARPMPTSGTGATAIPW